MQVVGTLRCKVLHHGGGDTFMYLRKASLMQVVGTLRHKVLHHGVGVCPHLAYAGGGDSDARSCTMGVGVCPCIFMQGLMHAGGGDTQMQGIAPWGWEYALASHMQVVETLKTQGLAPWGWGYCHLASDLQRGNIYVALSWYNDRHCIDTRYAGGGDTQKQGLAPWGWGYLCVFMQGLEYAGGGDTQMQGLAPWGWGYVLALHMQVVGTLRHKVLHYGGGGIPLHIYARPCICRWWGHSGARSCTMGYGGIVICHLIFKEVTSMLHCHGTMKGVALM